MEDDMTTPTPQRPTPADDLDRAYAQAHALAGGDPGPAASVRANVLAAAREIAAQAAAVPPLAPVAAPVSDVGRGRAGAWNLSSWRVRAGAAIGVVLLVGLAALRLPASRHGDPDVMVAAADAPPSGQVLPPPTATTLPGVLAQARVAAAPVEVAPVASARAKVAVAKAAPRTAQRVVEPADKAVMADAEAPQARRDPSTVIAALEPPPAAPTLTLGQRAPAADTLQRVEVSGVARGLSSAPGSQALRGSAEAVKKVAPAALGSVSLAAVRMAPTPLHAAANADDVDTLGRLLADPATRVDAPDANGRTPLLYAVMAANVRAVRMLLAAGADPDRADSAGATPRSVARTGPDAEIAALLAARR